MDGLRAHKHRAIGLLLLALALPGLWVDARMFFASWLVAWWFWLGVVLGGLANVWIQRLSGGRWGEVLRPVALLAARRLPVLLLLFLPMVAGMSLLYVWMRDPSGQWAHALTRPAFPVAWLQPRFFWVRSVIYAALWWWLSRPAAMAGKGRAAGALVIYLISGTLASVDLLMSLVPGWYSTAFGLVVLSGQCLGGTGLTVLLLAFGAPGQVPQPAPHKPPLWRDFGNLLLMWLMTWAYLAFMEFLIIWAENLPHEIAWFVPRLQTGWVAVALALVVLQLALPLLALLMRALKDKPQRVGAIAAWLLGTQLLNTAWLVLPSVAPGNALGWWLVPLLTAGMGLLLFGRVPAELAARSQVFEPQEVRHASP